MGIINARLIFPLWFTLVLLGATWAWCDQGPALTIGVGRDFYDGPDSRAFLHGSTHTWEGLTYLGPGLQAQPWLARSWTRSDDGRVWTFQLRDGILFHDGTPLTADLARASILRIASHPKYDASGVYRHLEGLEARDRLTLVFHLREPAPNFPNLVAYYSSPILNPVNFDDKGRLKGLTGTGPFAVDQIRPGDRIILKAFNRYWGTKPSFHRIVFRTLPDAQSRLMALCAGDIDAVADVGGILPQQVDFLRNSPNVTLQSVRVATTHYLLFNCKKTPFNDVEARQWLRNRLSREDLGAVLVAGAGNMANDPYTPLAKSFAFGLLTPRPGHCPDDNKQVLTLLLHAGTLERWPYKDLSMILQARLAESGFQSEIHIREPGAYYEDIRRGRFDMALQPNTLMTGDPDFFYSYYVESDGVRYCGCGTEAMDSLIQRGRTTLETRDRQNIYRQLAGKFNERLPVFPLYHDVCYYAYGPGIKGFAMDHNFRPMLIEAKPEKKH